MHWLGTTCAIFLLIGTAAAHAQDSCKDPWEKLQGTYKCEGPCSYTAEVCNLSEYAEGIRRWRFSGEKGSSTTGIHIVSGAATISFSTQGKWGFTRASTADCGATIAFEGEPAGARWRKVSDTASCGGRRRR